MRIEEPEPLWWDDYFSELSFEELWKWAENIDLEKECYVEAEDLCYMAR